MLVRHVSSDLDLTVPQTASKTHGHSAFSHCGPSLVVTRPRIWGTSHLLPLLNRVFILFQWIYFILSHLHSICTHVEFYSCCLLIVSSPKSALWSRFEPHDCMKGARWKMNLIWSQSNLWRTDAIIGDLMCLLICSLTQIHKSFMENNSSRHLISKERTPTVSLPCSMQIL